MRPTIRHSQAHGWLQPAILPWIQCQPARSGSHADIARQATKLSPLNFLPGPRVTTDQSPSKQATRALCLENWVYTVNHYMLFRLHDGLSQSSAGCRPAGMLPAYVTLLTITFYLQVQGHCFAFHARVPQTSFSILLFTAS
ncbi:hypothetical protein KP509_04G006000 [Ceratopteris richardii]|uniref:Uncharacterized protein n=1 Tax=Ceratopteris richardii TaxID=49495 RepID=A0A8T2USB1_CERRI|nr:hypothetical protein KP509_04G006000 [Ceratopteris richardii]